MIQYINDTNYKKMIEGKAEYLLYFYSEACRPCKMTSPAVEAFANENPELTIGKAETSLASALCDKFRVKSVPTLVFVREGAEAARITGKCSRDDISRVVFDREQS